MRFPWREWVATFFVGAGVVAYVIWLVGSESPGDAAIRVMTGSVLALGFAASATAVVPAFDQLMRGSRTYLWVASTLGLLALVTGLWALFAADEAMLAALVVVTVALWVIATVRHIRSARSLRPAARPARQVVSAGR